MHTCPSAIVVPLATHREAVEIVTHPEDHHDRPGLRLIAWAHLMTRRGRSVRWSRLRADQRERGMI